MSEDHSEENHDEQSDEKAVANWAIDERQIGRMLIPFQREMARIAENLTLPSREIERMARSLRAIDFITPQMLRPMELGMSAKIADLLASHSIVAASRNAMLAHSRLAEAVARPEWFESMRLVVQGFQSDIGSQLVAMSSLTASLASLPGLQLSTGVEMSFATTMRSWDAYARRLTPPTTEGGIMRTRSAGTAALGIAATVATIGGESDQSRLAEPWETAPEVIRERMFERLEAMDPRLVTKLNGAWDRMNSPGPDGFSQCATSVIELIDWFLRGVAPDDEVLEWHRDSGRSDRELHEGGPTRQLRIRFALRDRQPDGRLANAYVATLTSIAEELQGIKHSGMGSDMAPIARLLPSVEAAVGFVIL